MDHRGYLKAVPDARKISLTARNDYRGLRHGSAHFGLIAVVGWGIGAGVPFWPLLIPLQGVLIVFLFTLSHEATHQTPFASKWLNEVAGHFIGLLLLLPFHWFRAFHLAHHRWTNIAGKDPELDAPKPATPAAWALHISGLPLWWASITLIFRLAIRREAPSYLGKRSKPLAEREAQVMLCLYAAIICLSVFDPILLWVWVIPVILGQPALRLYLLAEHGDCPQVTNMFANTRTVFTTRIIRFLAWNMPYHTEHHVWPQVPFHQLPALHADMRAHLQVTSDGYTAFTRSYLARLQLQGNAVTPNPDIEKGATAMTRALNAQRREPISGETRSAVIFLHGYGANGADLLGLADPLGEHLPDTLFMAPDAPEDCAGAPMGFQWFPIPWIDGSSEEESKAGLDRAAEDLNAFLDGVMIDEDLLPEQVFVLGFSQGTMMALHVLPRREDAVAGLAAFSGRLLEPELLVDEVVSRPPVLLIHGDQDDVVPPQSLPAAAEALQEAGWKEVYAHVMKGTAHGIAPDGLQVALAFMRDRLGLG